MFEKITGIAIVLTLVIGAMIGFEVETIRVALVVEGLMAVAIVGKTYLSIKGKTSASRVG